MGNLQTLGLSSELSSGKATGGASVTRLSNGLSIIHQAMPTSAVAIDVWVEAGASKEPAGWTGMAHFLEHMVFKGTHKLRPGEFDLAVESRGGVSNAATSHDYAHYYITVAAEAVPDTLPYLADLVLGAAIPEREFEPERNVVLEEIRQANDDPDWVGYQTLCGLLYNQHAYGRPVLGTPETLATFSPEMMRQFHAAHYQPENMTVAIAGNLSKERAIAMVEKAFVQFPKPTSCPAPAPQTQGQPAFAKSLPEKTAQKLQHQTLRLPHLEQCRLSLAWVGPGVDELAAACHMDLISTILGGGRSSRLVRDLREEQQLIQEIDVDFSLQRDCGEFSLTLWLEEDKLEQVEASVKAAIASLSTHAVKASELNRAKRLLINDYAFSTETPSQIAGLYGYYATIANPELANIYPCYLQAATSRDLQQTAQKYLNLDSYTAVVLKPE